MAVFIFIVVMVVIGAAFAIPVVWAAGDRRKDANMVAMGGALLGGGVNGVGLGLAVFVLATEDLDTVPLLRPLTFLLPVLAALAAGHAIFRVGTRLVRNGLLILAALLSLGGVFSVVFYPVGGVAALVAAGCYAVSIGEPRALLRRLDPRE